jgi:serine/threonine-protein kinase
MSDDITPSTAPDERFEQALAELLLAEERGEPLDLTRVLRTAPDLETPLREFFRDRDGFNRLAGCLGRPQQADTPLVELAPGSRLAGYEVIEEVGHGGRGIVYRVTDPEMNRPLAVKVLRPELRGEPDAVRRFLEEAQVTGQLQHPGIVPVHAIGQLPDGRPYLVMKLIQGRTLAKLLAERPAPAHDLPGFLSIFQQVCQAVAYAHSRGVIHRDLKPANVMVGAFAEVQVMDWGLAKVLAERGFTNEAKGPGQEDAKQASTIRTVRTEAMGLSSVEGTVTGTFAYMSPEQARGQVEEIDRRSDVFGLGAVLCEVLTGQGPFAGLQAWKLQLTAAAPDLDAAFARLDCCGADAELIALAKDCLAPEREHRPRDAAAVAERLATYLAEVQDRLRRAELDKAAAQARAEESRATARAERRARRLTAGLAVAVLAVLMSLTVGGLWLQRKQAEETRQAEALQAEEARQAEARQAEEVRQAEALQQDVGALLAQAGDFRKGGHFEESHGLLKQAQQRLGTEGPADLRAKVGQALADTELAKRLDAARLRVSNAVGDGELNYAGGAKEYAAALQEAGLGQEGEDAEVVAARVRASTMRAEVVAALDEWASATRDLDQRTWLVTVARAADPDPERDRLRQAWLRRDREALARMAQVPNLSPQLAAALGRTLSAIGGDALPLLREAQALHPDDFWLNFGLAGELCNVKQWDEAIGFYRAALALRPRVAILCYNLGFVNRERGRLDEAISYYEQALSIDPKDARILNNLGTVLAEKGRLDEAIDRLEQSLHIDGNAATVHHNLGKALRDKGRLDQAMDHFRKAFELNPGDAMAHSDLGMVLRAKGLLDEAIGEHKKALEIDDKCDLAHIGLGNSLQEKGCLDEAVGHYRKALGINPKNATAYNNLGAALAALGRFVEARDAMQTCLDLLPERDPMRATVPRQLQYCKRLLVLEGQLPAIVSGEKNPANAAEGLEFAWICQGTKQYGAAVRLYTGSLPADAKQPAPRFNAACCAVLAAAVLEPEDNERPRLRRKALAWLRADLDLWTKRADASQAESGALVRRILWAWQNNPALASVRDRDGLEKFPDEERRDWEKLWADVDELLGRVRQSK